MGNSMSEHSVAHHFIAFEHVATFPVARICSLVPESTCGFMNKKDTDSYVEATDPIQMNHNHITQKLSCLMVMKTFTSNKNGVYERITKLCPCLRLSSSSLYPSITATYELSAVPESGSIMLISTGEKIFCRNQPTLLTTWDAKNWMSFNDRCLPTTPVKLTKNGYLNNGGTNLILNYKLKVHRSYFVGVDGKYDIPIRKILPPIPRPAGDFDKFDFEQLTVEVNDDSRIVLVSADGMRFCAHKNRLLRASDVFKGALEFRKEQQKELQNHEKQCEVLRMPDMSCSALIEMLHFIYMGTVSHRVNHLPVIEQLAYGADKYLLKDLKTLCHARFLEHADSPRISSAQIVRFLCLAHHVKMTELKIRCMEWLHDRWNAVKGEDEVQNLKKNEEGREIIWELLNYVMNRKIGVHRLTDCIDFIQQLPNACYYPKDVDKVFIRWCCKICSKRH